MVAIRMTVVALVFWREVVQLARGCDPRNVAASLGEFRFVGVLATLLFLDAVCHLMVVRTEPGCLERHLPSPLLAGILVCTSTCTTPVTASLCFFFWLSQTPLAEDVPCKARVVRKWARTAVVVVENHIVFNSLGFSLRCLHVSVGDHAIIVETRCLLKDLACDEYISLIDQSV